MGGEAELEHDQTLEATLTKREGGGLDHLVCDFNDLDAEKTIKDYERLMKLSQSTTTGPRHFPNLSNTNNENRKPYRNKILNNRWGVIENNKLSSISSVMDHRNRFNSQPGNGAFNQAANRYNGTTGMIHQQRPYMQVHKWAHL